MICSVICLFLSLNMVVGEDYTFRKQLFENIIDPLNPQIRPVLDESSITNVSITFNLVAITEFDELRQTLCSNGFFEVTWQDELIKWNPYHNGGVVFLMPRFDDLWKPPVALHNIVDDLKPIGLEHGVVLVWYNGTVLWYPGSSFKTFCRMDVTRFPFDVQICKFELFMWGSTIAVINFSPANEGVSLDVYNQNSEWKITKTTSYADVRKVSGYDLPYVSYSVYLKRRPSVKIMTVILPVLVLCLLNVVVFLIPVLSGEKLSFAITVLLSFAVFMSFITNMLPHSADSLSIFALLMAGLFVLSSIYVILTIWVVHIFHRDHKKRPIPNWIKRLMKRDSRVEPLDLKSEKPRVEKRTSDSNSCDDLTWRKVSEAVDKVFFWVFLILAMSLLGATIYLISP